MARCSVISSDTCRCGSVTISTSTRRRRRARYRGVRRIVCGGAPRYTGECYDTGDHYAFFK
ncbi:ribonuclease domain-containing protein [Mycetohabitans sp. B5]|uniref:ribonuclease domain-containing protein n=1 Tax=Mycetohabitans sp. B5 TaxID=2841846 RepID=UPI00351CE8D8